ncbi:MAG: Arm DNA-binding domain-containing protein [Pseudomonadota bacterium]
MAKDGTLVGRKPKGRHPDKRLSVPAVNAAGQGRHPDGNGLYLEIEPSRSKRWTLRTVVRGRRRDIGLGGASYVNPAEAREMARRLRKIARQGGDPIAERDKDKRNFITFEEAARKVRAEHIVPVNKNTKANAQWLSSLEAYVFPTMGRRPVFAVEQADVLRALGPIWIEKPETENAGQKGPYLTATIARTYKTEDGGYADTASFGIGDLPRVAQLASLAYAQGLELRKDLAPSEEQACGSAWNVDPLSGGIGVQN